MELYEYVRQLRKEHGITIKGLCHGICSESLGKQFERGEREVNAFVMFRIMERLENNEGNLQYFMKNQEYEKWQKRMEILDAIRRNNYEAAEELICRWEAAMQGKDVYAEQFLHRMRSFCMIHKDNDTESIREEVAKALRITVPEFETEWKNCSLSMQEMDMLLDYYHYAKDNTANEIRDIITYMKQKPQVFYRRNLLVGKAVVLYAEEMDNWDEEQLLEIKLLSENALEALQKKDCRFYMWEILKLRRRILKELRQRNGLECEEEIEANERWTKAFSMLYEELGLELETGEILLLYAITNVECISSVIKRRRRMLGMTEEEVANNMCDARTVTRIEMSKNCPQTSTLELLLEQIGLPGVWKKSYFLSFDVDMQRRIQELVVAYDNKRYKEVLRIVECEKGKYNDKEIYNLQNLEWYRIEAEYYLGRIDARQAIQKLKDNLERTVQWKDIIESDMDYVSLNEAKHVTAILLHMEKEDLEFEKLLEVVSGYVEKSLGAYKEMNYNVAVVVSLNILQSRYADAGEYELANRLCMQRVGGSFFRGDISELMNVAYDLWWNRNELNKTDEEVRPSYLIDVANLICRSNIETFLRQKFER